MTFDLIAGFFIGLAFVAAGVFSLLMIFNPQLRSWYLKRSERRRWHLWPVKKSDVQLRRETGEGFLLAGSVLIALIFLPLGLIMLIVCAEQILAKLFR
jgi:hypothetical protein